MRVYRYCFTALLVFAIGCVTNDRRLAELLVNPKYNVIRQRKYIADTQPHLANSVRTNTPTFVEPHTYYVRTNGLVVAYWNTHNVWIPINANSWLYIVWRSSHHDNTQYPDVGDLSVGIDPSGRYYFSRQHVCGGLEITLPSSRRFSDIREFLVLNPAWHRLPSNWQRLAPKAPPVDIKTHVVGKWRPIPAHTSTGLSLLDIEFENCGTGQLPYHYSYSNAWEYGSGVGGCDVISASRITIENPMFNATLHLAGNDLVGTLEEPVEDRDGIMRLPRIGMTNSVEAIHSHTNHYNVRLRKVVAPETPAN